MPCLPYYHVWDEQLEKAVFWGSRVWGVQEASEGNWGDRLDLLEWNDGEFVGRRKLRRGEDVREQETKSWFWFNKGAFGTGMERILTTTSGDSTCVVCNVCEFVVQKAVIDFTCKEDEEWGGERIGEVPFVGMNEYSSDMVGRVVIVSASVCYKSRNRETIFRCVAVDMRSI